MLEKCDIDMGCCGGSDRLKWGCFGEVRVTLGTCGGSERHGELCEDDEG